MYKNKDVLHENNIRTALILIWIKRFTLMSLGVVVSIFLIEISLRLFSSPHDEDQNGTFYFPSPYPGVGYVHRRDVVIRDFGLDMHVNNYGLRGRDIHMQKPKDEFRILVIGDSVTWSAGVPDDGTYVHILEQELNRASLKGNRQTRYHVINGGHSGYSGRQGMAYLESYGMQLNPDLILIQFFLNDPMPIAPLAGTNPETGAVAWWVPIKNWARDNSVLAILALRKYYNWRHQKNDNTYRGRSFWLQDYQQMCQRLYDPEKKDWPNYLEVLERFKRISREKRVPLVFLIFPMNIDLTENHPFLSYYHQVEEALDHNQIPHFNLFDEFRAYDEESLWVNETDFHLNDIASRVAGEAIRQYLYHEGWVPISPAYSERETPHPHLPPQGGKE